MNRIGWEWHQHTGTHDVARVGRNVPAAAYARSLTACVTTHVRHLPSVHIPTPHIHPLAAWNPFFDGKAALAKKAAEAAAVSHEVVEELLERTRKVRVIKRYLLCALTSERMRT